MLLQLLRVAKFVRHIQHEGSVLLATPWWAAETRRAIATERYGVYWGILDESVRHFPSTALLADMAPAEAPGGPRMRSRGNISGVELRHQSRLITG